MDKYGPFPTKLSLFNEINNVLNYMGLEAKTRKRLDLVFLFISIT